MHPASGLETCIVITIIVFILSTVSGITIVLVVLLFL
jgi:hypothetical protein